MTKIIYEDKHIIACEKAVGQTSEITNEADSLPNELKAHTGNIYTLHRLDKPVGGAIIYAKTKAAASAFSALIAENGIEKKYLAVTDGIPEKEHAELCDLLFKDSRKNKTFVVSRMRKGVKEAKLNYKILSENENKALLEVTLITGRSHQIRAQFASRKLPLCGDGKYGSKNNCNIALWSHSLSFIHPFTKTETIISCEPDYTKYPWNLFKTK